MAVHNHALAKVPTVFLAPDPDTADISSTQIRRLLADGRVADAATLVAPNARPLLRDLATATLDPQPA